MATSAERRAARGNRWGPKLSAVPPPPAPPGGGAASTALVATTTTTDDADASNKPKRRRSRWEPAEDAAAAGRVTAVASSDGIGGALVLPGGLAVRLPATMIGEDAAPADATEEIKSKFAELARINRRMLAHLPFDERSERSRSPSPEPIYDANGVRQNTREVLDKEKYHTRRMELVEQLVECCPGFVPPPDYRPAKKSRKIFIPVAKHPGYNFFGLIIGPRGNTQKRMQAETNTKIAIRGKGSVKEGAARGPTGGGLQPGEDEPMHVYVEGTTQKDVDAAAAMIEKLIVPVDEDVNDHKRIQLRELALLNGTLRDDNFLDMRAKRDEEDAGLYALPADVAARASAQYQKDVDKVHGAGAGGAMDNAYGDFLAELGVANTGAGAPGAGGVPGARAGLGFAGGDGRGGSVNEVDRRKCYVGHLGPNTTTEEMVKLFGKFGDITQVDVIPDREREINCKGFAFVTFSAEEAARAAAAEMNSYYHDGRTIECRVKSDPRPPPEQRAKPPETPENNDAKLYVAYMPFSYGADELRAMLSQYGLVVDAKVIVDRETGKSRGFGFAQMMDAAQAQAAIAHLNGVFFEGKQMVVRIAGQQNRPGMGGAIGAGATGAPQAGVGAPVGYAQHPGYPAAAAYGGYPAVAPGADPYAAYAASYGGWDAQQDAARWAAAAQVAAADPAAARAAAAAGDPYAAYYVQQADMMAAAAGGVGVGVGDPYAAWGAAGAAPGTEAPPGVEAPPGTEAAAPAAPPPPAAVGGIAAGDPAAAPPPPPPPPGEMEQEMEM